jgi:hypothetical protein
LVFFLSLSKMTEPEIPFEPADNDIVSTKIRTWNRKHPGNIFYAQLINSNVKADPSRFVDPAEVRKVAQGLYKILAIQRGGRFLKLPECALTSETCTVMSEKRSVEKIIHAYV